MEHGKMVKLKLYKKGEYEGVGCPECIHEKICGVWKSLNPLADESGDFQIQFICQDFLCTNDPKADLYDGLVDRASLAEAALVKFEQLATDERCGLVEALKKYGDHLGTCYANLNMGKCNCGLEQALKLTSNTAQEATGQEKSQDTSHKTTPENSTEQERS